MDHFTGRTLDNDVNQSSAECNIGDRRPRLYFVQQEDARHRTIHPRQHFPRRLNRIGRGAIRIGHRFYFVNDSGWFIDALFNGFDDWMGAIAGLFDGRALKLVARSVVRVAIGQRREAGLFDDADRGGEVTAGEIGSPDGTDHIADLFQLRGGDKEAGG